MNCHSDGFASIRFVSFGTHADTLLSLRSDTHRGAMLGISLHGRLRVQCIRAIN
jgi:hypothetical protein